LSVNTGDPTSGNVVVNWFHEVLNLMTSSTDTTHNNPTNNWTNYGSYNGTDSINFHYTDSDSVQYLPLQSINWPGGTDYKIVQHQSTITWTDVPGCHGMSGSGSFLNGTSTLLGPVVNPGSGLGSRLCYEMLSATHGAQNGSYINAPNARLIEQYPTSSGGVVLGDR
jgi:hypothetical protein